MIATSIAMAVIAAATPLLFAAIGELVAERAGVLNLGVEGMMLIGAVTSFAVTVTSGSWVLGIIAGALAGSAMALLFGVLTLSLMANQVGTGLALTLFGIGLSSLLGRSFVGIPLPGLPRLDIPGLSDLPVIGPLLFGQDILVYLSVALAALVAWVLKRTRMGLMLRAAGESARSAHSLGLPVIGIRYGATLFGGAAAGLGGAFLALAYTPMWAENMTAGRGWIAIALVVFGSWRPWRVLAGAYLFGGVSILQMHAQGVADLPPQLFAMLPYAATIIVLTVISAGPWKARLNAPADLGKPFHPSL